MNRQPEESLGKRLRRLRKNANMTQAKLSEQLNMDGDTYGNYEREKTEPSIGTIIDLANIYNVTTDYILIGKDIDADARVSSLMSQCIDEIR